MVVSKNVSYGFSSTESFKDFLGINKLANGSAVIAYNCRIAGSGQLVEGCKADGNPHIMLAKQTNGPRI